MLCNKGDTVIFMLKLKQLIYGKDKLYKAGII